MVENLVSILIPTRGRAKQLKKHIRLIRKNTFYEPYELLLMVDEDDEATIKVCRELELRHFIHSVSEDGRDFFVAKINRGFKESEAEYFIYFSDDVRVESGWLKATISHFKNEFPDEIGLVAFDDGFYHERLAPHGLVSRKWIDKLQFGGWLLWPDYLHYHGDQEITQVAKKVGRFSYCEKAKAIHIRPKNPEKRDSIWKEMHEYCWPIDTNLFYERRRVGFPGYGA